MPGVFATIAIASQRNLVPPAVWKRLPAEGEFSVTTASGATFRYRAGTGDQLARPLRWRGLADWEAQNLVAWQALLHEATNVFDVGANTGVYSLVALAEQPGCRVQAFEPVERIADRAQTNIDLNGWTDRCTVHRAGVAAESGTVSFFDPGTDVPTSARLATAQYRSDVGETITIPVVALDDVAGEPPDLIKIDVEGAEDAVVAGLEMRMATTQPSLVFECHPEGPIEAMQACMNRHDYSLFHVFTDRIAAVETIQPCTDRKQNNFVAAARAGALAAMSRLTR